MEWMVLKSCLSSGELDLNRCVVENWSANGVCEDAELPGGHKDVPQVQYHQ